MYDFVFAPVSSLGGASMLAGFLHLGMLLMLMVCTVDVALGSQQGTSLVWDVYFELCTGKTIILEWTADVVEYSVAVPYDAPLVRLLVATAHSDFAEEEGPFADGGGLSLSIPLRNIDLNLSRDVASEYVYVPIDMQTVLKLDIAGSEYVLRVIRSRIASNGQGEHPDRARSHPPLGTLSGLALWDSKGRPASMAWFVPRTSFYYASVGEDTGDLRLVATSNDPEAELSWRRNGGKWDYLVSGLISAPTPVSSSGWTLVEVRVRSTEAMATGGVSEPLVYQIAVTKEIVCHPKCRSCRGPGSEECLSCNAPLVLHDGKCLYTSCQSVGRYFDPQREVCLACDPTCAECEESSKRGCTVCPPMRYLLVASALDVAGECATSCPYGYFVQPTSQRCERSPPSLRVERFYVRLALRITVDEFTEKPQLLQEVLRVAADTLAVSPQDVRFHRWQSHADGLRVHYFLEVENPFLRHRDVEERISIDEWFAALPVPVDSVTALSQSQLYPSPLPPEPEPAIKPWMWAVIAAGFSIVCILYPMYHFYFIRKHYQNTHYKPKETLGRDHTTEFIDEIVNSAQPKHLNLLSSYQNASH